MRINSAFLRPSISFLAIITFAMLFAETALAQTETILYSFTGGADGATPFSTLVFDPAGNLYGTTNMGGNLTNPNCTPHGCGTVFELSRSSGAWVKTTIYTFTGKQDGFTPGPSVAIDAAGNLYGAAIFGGAPPACPSNFNGLCGLVFELSPNGSGGWSYSVLHNFHGPDGVEPTTVTLDGAGNLYGSASYGGASGYGTAFKLSPNGSGKWKLTNLFSFNGQNGSYPNKLLVDASGIIYGTTYYGGKSQCMNAQCGVVFKLSPAANGGWRESVLYEFGAGDVGIKPTSGLVEDAHGNLYGTTNVTIGNGEKCGSVFELSPNGSGWTRSLLHVFANGGDEGVCPNDLALDAAGNLFGTTSFGGASDLGTVFELSPSAGGWNESILHSFAGTPTDGNYPLGGVVLDALGNLYGTTEQGGLGTADAGIIYEIMP